MADARVMLQKRKRKKGKKTKRTDGGKELASDDNEDFHQVMANDQVGPIKTASACRLLRMLVQTLSNEAVEIDVVEISALFLLACNYDIVLAGAVIQTPFIQRRWRDRVTESAAAQAVSAIPVDHKMLPSDVLVYIAHRIAFQVLSPQWIAIDETQLVFDIELCIDLLNSMNDNEIAIPVQYRIPAQYGIPVMTVGYLIRLLNTLLLVYSCTRRATLMSMAEQRKATEGLSCELAQDQILMHSVSDSLSQLAKRDHHHQYMCWLITYPSEEMQRFFNVANSAHEIARQFKTGRCLRISNELGDVAMGIAARYLLVTSWWGGRSCDLALWQHLIVEMVALVGHILTTHADLLPTLDALERDHRELTAAMRAPQESDIDNTAASESVPMALQQQHEDLGKPSAQLRGGAVNCCEDCKARAARRGPTFVPCEKFEFMPSDEPGLNAHIHACSAFMLAVKALRRKVDGRQEIVSPAEAIDSVFSFEWRATVSLKYSPWIVPASS